MPVYVRSYRRGTSTVKSYARALAAGSSGPVKRASVNKLKVKYGNGFRRMNRQGWDFDGFILRTVRRARRRR